MARDDIFIMAVSGVYGYHATKTGPKCSLVWMSSCFVIPPSVKCRYLGTWDEISEKLHRHECDAEINNVMPRMLTHAELHSDSQDSQSYRVSPEPFNDYSDYDINSEHHENGSYEQDDQVDDYLAEYANLMESKENEDEIQLRPVEHCQIHEERRNLFGRRKSCSDVKGKSGLSMSLTLPKESNDDLAAKDNLSISHPVKPEMLDLKNITAMARRMSIPILDKSEDVDHGTKIYAETMIKKSKTTKQFREAFSEETDDYIPHRHAATLSKSLTTNEIENACDNLKSVTPGSYKNIVSELKLRGQTFNETHCSNDDHEESPNSKMSKKLTTNDIEQADDVFEIESPVQYKSVLRELQHRVDDKTEVDQNTYESLKYNNADSLLENSFDLSRNRANGERLNRQNEHAKKGVGYSHNASVQRSNLSRNRNENYLKDDHFSKTLPVDFAGNISGSSTPRSQKSDSSFSRKHSKQKNEEPVSDLMRKLTNLTAQTRMATRPSLGNVEGYDASSSKMTRSQSVMHVSSPLTPRYDHNALSSSFSSTASSSSADIPSLSYHDVVDPCYRCWKTVYSLDKIGPIRKVLYHKQCFRCVKCNTMLSLNTYKQNVNDKSDVQVYCKKHVSTLDSPHIGLEAKNLSVVMNHPKLDPVNQNIRGTLEDRRKSRNLHPLMIGRAVSTPRLDLICSPNENSNINSASYVDNNGNVSLRELKTDDKPKTVWSRSTFSAAKLDLSVPVSGRKGSSLYRTADTWNYL